MAGAVLMVLAMLVVIPFGLLLTGALWAALLGELGAGGASDG